MNQMSALARRWNHINIWWCMAGCRAFEHGHNRDTESSQHLVISGGKAGGFMTPSEVNGHAKQQKQTTQLCESETFLHRCFSRSLTMKCFLNFMISAIIATDVDVICDLGFEFVLDSGSEILPIYLADCQQSAFEIGLEISLHPTTSQLLLRLSCVVSGTRTVPSCCLNKPRQMCCL